MEKKKVEFSYTVFNSTSELSQVDQQLLLEAEKAFHSAYAPYSNFKVGSAVRMVNGKIIVGSNQENIAYPSGLCAERVAVFSASANYSNERMETIAVYSQQIKGSNIPITPCGACRQVMAEYESKQAILIRILLCSVRGNVLLFDSVSDLLPFAFKF